MSARCPYLDIQTQQITIHASHPMTVPVYHCRLAAHLLEAVQRFSATDSVAGIIEAFLETDDPGCQSGPDLQPVYTLDCDPQRLADSCQPRCRLLMRAFGLELPDLDQQADA